jgi:phage terminase small subunit
MLSARRQRFVIEYCVDFNATQAAIRSGYSEATSGQIGHELLKNIEIQNGIQERKNELAAAASITPEWILNQWKMIAIADPNELVSMKIKDCCRYCWGDAGLYQWTAEEYSAAFDTALRTAQPIPKVEGGFGFDPTREARTGCESCHAYPELQIADTTRLKGPARRLYAGVEKTKEGIKIKMRDQSEALKNLAQWRGMMVDRKEISAPGGGAIQLQVNPKELTDAELEALITRARAASEVI